MTDLSSAQQLALLQDEQVALLKRRVLLLFNALKGIEHHAQEIVIDCYAEIQEGANSPDVHACLRNWQAVLAAISAVENR